MLSHWLYFLKGTMVKALIAKNDKIEVLKNIVVPKRYYHRIDLGVAILNEIFGGQEMPGILPGASILFTGSPGAGKSTLALQLADLMSKNSGRNVLFNVGEENRFMAKLRADRIGVKGNFAISQIEEVDELLEYCDRHGVEVLFQDSLQTLRDGEIAGNARLRTIVKKIQASKELSGMTSIIIGHSTKGGQFAGPNEIKHDLDVHAHIRLDLETGNRIFELQKNRFGPAAIPYEFSISNGGLDFQQIKISETDDDEGDEKASKSADRRERICKLIKEKMIGGEKISGYCFERFDIECSGGFWRGMLAKAVKELERDGIKVIETKLDGRTHFAIEGA